MSKLPVSVVIPARNRARHIARAIASAKAQTPYPPAEIIVVDDGSTDDTAAVAEAMGALVIRHTQSLGSGPARNTGISRATQPWIALLDSDDEWLPWHLSWLWPHTDRYSFIAAASLVVFPDNADTQANRFGPKHGDPRVYDNPAEFIQTGNPITTSTVLAKKSTIESVGGFRPLPQAQDFDLWIRIVEQTPIYIADRVTAQRKVHDEQVSGDRKSAWQAGESVVRGFRDRDWLTPRVIAHYVAVCYLEELQIAKRTHGKIGAARTIVQQLFRSPRAFLFLPTARNQRSSLWQSATHAAPADTPMHRDIVTIPSARETPVAMH